MFNYHIVDAHIYNQYIYIHHVEKKNFLFNHSAVFVFYLCSVCVVGCGSGACALVFVCLFDKQTFHISKKVFREIFPNLFASLILFGWRLEC